MNQGGLCLYNEILDEKIREDFNENLITGAISSVNLLLEELTSDKGIVVINKKGKSICIYPGEFSFGVLFCSEELNYIRVLLKRFVDKFEAVFYNILKNWDGGVNIFESSRSIVHEIFHLER